MPRRALLVIIALVAGLLPGPASGQSPPAPTDPTPPPAPLPQARLTLMVPATVPIAPSIRVTGSTDTAGRLVVIVRSGAGRVLGRTIRTRIAIGRFSVLVALADVTRPGDAVLSAVLTDQTISATEVEQPFRIAPVAANFTLALPMSVPAGAQLPVSGEVTFAGRMVIVVRSGGGRVLARREVTLDRPGRFEILVRLSQVARPGRIRVSAILSSGTLRAEGEAIIRLTRTGPTFQLALPTSLPVGAAMPVTGRITFAGRMIIVVRTPTDRVIGRGVIALPRPGGFRTFIRLDEAARPGPVVVTAILSAGSTSAQSMAGLTLRPTGPNFQVVLPTTLRAGQAIPISGRINFPGRMVIVARAASGSVLGRQAIVQARAGAFRSVLRIRAGARPGPVSVTAMLTSGSLKADGQAALILV